MMKQGDAKHADFKSTYGESFKNPREQPAPRFLLNLKASGYCKNNLTNDGRTYYFDRKENREDMTITEYKSSFSGHKGLPWKNA